MVVPAFRIKVVEDDTGRTVEVEPDGVKPLSLDDLMSSEETGSKTYKLTFETPGAIVDGRPIQKRMIWRGEVTFNQPLRIYALARGGWLPPPLVVPPMFLVDRNVVGILRVIREGGGLQGSTELQWWLDLLRGGNIWFNPLPVAFEGSLQRTPTLTEFIASFNESAREIAESFPEARIPRFESESFEEMYRLVSDLATRTAREEEFLAETIPLVVEQAPANKLESTRNSILELARQYRVGPLVLVTVMSCLYDDRTFAIGRSVLNPGRVYAKNTAYNALSDLKQMELLMASMGLRQVGPFTLCTRDRGLALLWCALLPRFEAPGNPGMKFTLTIDQRLFPRLENERLEELRDALLSASVV